MPDYDDQERIARHLIIRGKVQGVWYRASAESRAKELGLVGWVRNRSDGTVEAVAAGPTAAVEAFITWAHDGPEHARVTEVCVSPHAAPAEREFVTRPTE